MVPITRRLPWPIDTFENEFTNALERILAPEAWVGMEKFAPKSNLAETEMGYEVTVELPGMKPEDFHVEFKGGELWITGEKKGGASRERKDVPSHRAAVRRVPPRDPAAGCHQRGAGDG
jgi:HSP20 family molecular chaperone IbpA